MINLFFFCRFDSNYSSMNNNKDNNTLMYNQPNYSTNLNLAPEPSPQTPSPNFKLIKSSQLKLTPSKWSTIIDSSLENADMNVNQSVNNNCSLLQSINKKQQQQEHQDCLYLIEKQNRLKIEKIAKQNSVCTGSNSEG